MMTWGTDTYSNPANPAEDVTGRLIPFGGVSNFGHTAEDINLYSGFVTELLGFAG